MPDWRRWKWEDEGKEEEKCIRYFPTIIISRKVKGIPPPVCPAVYVFLCVGLSPRTDILLLLLLLACTTVVVSIHGRVEGDQCVVLCTRPLPSSQYLLRRG